MKDFLNRNILNLITGLAVLVLIYLVLDWSAMTVLQRLGALFFLGLVLHLWEEGRYPGGFTDLITSKLNFTQTNPHFGEMVTASYALLITFVPLFFPNVAFLTIAALLVGVLEVVAHVAAAALCCGVRTRPVS